PRAPRAGGTRGHPAVFTPVRAAVLPPLPYAHARELVLLDALRLAEHTSNSFTLTRYEMLRDQARSFSAVAVATGDTLSLAGAGEPQQVPVTRVSGDFFRTLGVAPQVGRLFDESDARPESAGVALLSGAFWGGALGGDPGVVGRTVRLGAVPFTIVGVLPRDATFPFLDSADVWIPRYFELSLFTPERLRMGVGYLTAVARL